MAPEILRRETYDAKGDVWAATVVVFCMLVGRMPFNGKSKDEILKSIESHNWDEFRQARWSKISAKARDFIRRGLQVDWRNRDSSRQMLEHPWLKDVAPSIQKPVSTESM